MCTMYGTKCDMHYLEHSRSICEKVAKTIVKKGLLFIIAIQKYFDSGKNTKDSSYLCLTIDIGGFDETGRF